MELVKQHEEWAYNIFNYDRVLIEAARGHGKSMFVSIALPLWLAYRGYPCEILLVSFSEKQVENLMRKMQDAIQANSLLAELRPEADTAWRNTLFTFRQGITIYGAGFGTSVRGLHPDWIIVDDPLKDDRAMDPKTQLDYFMGALSGTAKKNTKLVVIGTPLDPGDLLEQLEGNPVYKFLRYPGDDGDGEAVGNPTFPLLFDKEKLEFFKKERGSLVYAREIRLQRIDPETQIFKEKYKTVNDTLQFPEFDSVRVFVDPAISEKEEACDTAITTWGKDAFNQRWELDTRLIHSDNVAEMLRELVKVCRIFKDRCRNFAVVVEAELFQRLLAERFREICLQESLDILVIEVTHTGTLGKHQRIQGLQPMWEARGIKLLPESPSGVQFHNYRPKAKNIRVDVIDAFSWCKDERVDQIFIKTSPLIGEVPAEVREEY